MQRSGIAPIAPNALQPYRTAKQLVRFAALNGTLHFCPKSKAQCGSPATLFTHPSRPDLTPPKTDDGGAEHCRSVSATTCSRHFCRSSPSDRQLHPEEPGTAILLNTRGFSLRRPTPDTLCGAGMESALRQRRRVVCGRLAEPERRSIRRRGTSVMNKLKATSSVACKTRDNASGAGQ